MVTSGQNINMRDSLRFRLSASIGAAVMFTLIISSAIFSWIGFAKNIDLEINSLRGITSVLSSSIAQDMADGNAQGVQSGLTSIRSFKNLEYALVVKPDGRAFSEMGIGSFLLMPNIDLGKQSPFNLLFRNKIWVEAPIIKAGSQVGSLHVLSNISHLRTAFFKSLLINLIVASATMIVAILISFRSVTRIVNPVTQLSQVMLQAGRSGIFSDRVEIKDRGEVGVLAGSFNTMVSRIETRDSQLQDYRTNLEQKVEIRTEELKVARDQAETANAAKSDFLATMSHEIRTPMNGMMVMAEMLAAAPLNARHRRYANVISRSGAGLLSIINDILDFSKIEAGQLELEETRVDIDNLVGDVANLFWDKANEKSLELVTQIARDVPAWVVGDPTRIGQVVTNLVNNALKFTAEGGVVVRVTNKSGSDFIIDQPVRLRFEVEDTGIGIAPDKQAAVFERFSQADQSTTRNFGGTGLGLSICQRLVEAMGGEIGLDSVPGEGSTFWFEVELKVEAESDAIQTGKNGTSKGPISGTIIELVCDQKLVRGSMAAMFTERGVEVRLHETQTGEMWNNNHVVMADAQWIDNNKDRLDQATVIAITAIGDTLSDRLVETGKVNDLVRLPLVRSEVEALCGRIESQTFLGLDALATSSESIQTFSDFSGRRILAVDDNAVNREVLRDALGVLNVEVTLAESGEKAIEILQDQSFDMVFMDCSMPGIDGFEATQIIRRREQERGSARIPVVALTAHVTGADAEKWRVSGMDGYLAKPFTIEGLSNQISTMCELQGEPVESEGEKRVDVVEQVTHDTPPAVAKVDEVEEPEPDEVVLINQQTLDFINSLGKSSSLNMASKIFGLYMEHAPAGIEAVLEAANSGNFTEIAKSSHALKSMSLSAGATAVGNCCQKIEDDANGEVSTELESDLAKLTGLLDETIEAMSDHIAANEKPDASAVA